MKQNFHKSAKLFLTLAVVAGLLVPVSASAISGKCLTFNTVVTYSGPGGMGVRKTIAIAYPSPPATAMCAVTASMNVVTAFLSGGPTINNQVNPSLKLVCARSPASTGPASCMAACGGCGGSTTIDSSDSLPVELLQFGVE